MFETALAPVLRTRRLKPDCWLLSVPDPLNCTFIAPPLTGVLVGPLCGVFVRVAVAGKGVLVDVPLPGRPLLRLSKSSCLVYSPM